MTEVIFRPETEDVFKEDISKLDKALADFITTTKEEYKSNRNLYYEVILANKIGTQVVNKTAQYRLFVSLNGTPCRFKKGSCRRGFPLNDYNQRVVGVKLLTTKSIPENVVFDRDCEKILKYLNESGLWDNINKEVTIYKTLGYDYVKKLYDNFAFGRGRIEQHKDIDKDIEENLEVYSEIVKILEEKGVDKETIEFLKEFFYVRVDDNTLRYLQADIKVSTAFYNTPVFSVDSFTRDFEWINKAKIKTMIFHKSRWDNAKTEHIRQNIAEALKNRTYYECKGFNGYDVSFEYDPEKNKAWYSEEYVGCGNGHYYLALDSTHAIYYEKD